MFNRLIAAFLAVSALAFAAPASVSAQAERAPSEMDPLELRFRALTIMRLLDDRCARLSFGERSALDDELLNAYVRLAPLADPISELTAASNFEKMEAISAPLVEQAEAQTANTACEEAAPMLERWRIEALITIFAHIQHGRADFDASALDREKRLAGNMLNLVRQVVAGQPEGTLERGVASAMQNIEITPKEAFDYARRLLYFYTVSAGLNSNGFTLRWSADDKGWHMLNISDGERATRHIYVKPFIGSYYRQLEKRADDSFLAPVRYEVSQEIVIFPRKGKGRVGFEAFPLLPSQPLLPSVASVSPKFVSELAETSTQTGCPQGAQCFTFSSNTSGVLVRAADDAQHWQGAMLAVHAPLEVGNREGAQRINQRVDGERPPMDYLPLRAMFED